MVNNVSYSCSLGIGLLFIITSATYPEALYTTHYGIGSATGSSRNSIHYTAGGINSSNARKWHDTVPSADYDFYISNNGSNANTGKLASAPKLNIDSTENLLNAEAAVNNGSSAGLEANSIFREQYDPGADNINISAYNMKAGSRLPMITGMDVIRDWSLTPGTSSEYEHMLYHAIDFFSPEYTYVLIAETDTVLEKTNPLAAVKYLVLAANPESCSSTPGTYYAPSVTVNPLKIYIHPTTGAPGKNRYRYDVTTRNFNINGYYVNNAKYENLLLQSSAYGYGMLAGGDQTQVKKVIFQGGSTHHTVIKSGTIDSCFFLPGPRGLKDRIAAIFYKADGKGDINKISNTVFLDVPYAAYTHTDGVSRHSSLTIDKVYAFADTTDALIGLGAADTDSITVTNTCIDGYPTSLNAAAGRLAITNSMFTNVTQAAIKIDQPANVDGNITISNVLIKTNGNDYNQTTTNNWFALASGRFFQIRKWKCRTVLFMDFQHGINPARQ